MVNQRVQNAVLGCNLKNHRMISICFQGKPFNITVIQAYAPTSNTEEAEVEWFYEELQDLLEPTPKKHVLFIRGLECRSRKSRNTWSNRQIRPWSMEWSRANGDRVGCHCLLHIRTADSLEKSLMLGKIEDRRKRGCQRMEWMDGITNAPDLNLSNLGRWWGTERPGVLQSMGSQSVGHDWATEQQHDPLSSSKYQSTKLYTWK